MNTYIHNNHKIINNRIIHKTLIFAVLFSLSILKNYSSEAAVKNYVGAFGSTWNTAGNWSPNGVPVNGDIVTISSGVTVILNTNVSFTSGSISISGNSNLISNNSGPAETITIGGTATFSVASSSTVAPNNFILNAGTATINGELTPTNTLTQNGGTLTNNGSSIITGSHVILNAGTFNNNGSMIVGGQFQLLGATLNNSSSGFIMAMSSNNSMTSGTLNNNGSIDFQTNGGNIAHSGGTINNNSGATMTFNSYSGTGGVFNNNAGSTLDVESQINIGNGTTGVTFTNAGNVVGNTNLNLYGGGSFTSTGNINLMGNLNVLAGATINLPSGTAHFESNSTVAGTLNLGSADLDFAHSLNIATGGTINATGDYSISVDVFVVNGTLNAHNGSSNPDIIVTGNINGNGTIKPTGSHSATISYPINAFGGSLFGTDNNAGTLTLGPNLLPVEFISFNAQVNENSVTLKWATASESSNDYFTIERSTDGTHFETVSNIDGAGNSNAMLNYLFVDENSYSGTSYYRIKQTDFNGEFEYSKTIATKSNAESPLLFSNPSDGVINLTVDLESIKTIEVYDLLGHVIHYSEYWNTESPSGKKIIEINLTNNSRGTYIIKSLNTSLEANAYKIIVE